MRLIINGKDVDEMLIGYDSEGNPIYIDIKKG